MYLLNKIYSNSQNDHQSAPYDKIKDPIARVYFFIIYYDFLTGNISCAEKNLSEASIFAESTINPNITDCPTEDVGFTPVHPPKQLSLEFPPLI